MGFKQQHPVGAFFHEQGKVRQEYRTSREGIRGIGPGGGARMVRSVGREKVSRMSTASSVRVSDCPPTPVLGAPCGKHDEVQRKPAGKPSGIEWREDGAISTGVHQEFHIQAAVTKGGKLQDGINEGTSPAALGGKVAAYRD